MRIESVLSEDVRKKEGSGIGQERYLSRCQGAWTGHAARSSYLDDAIGLRRCGF